MRHFPALILEPRPSRCLLIAGGGGHALAVIALMVSTAPTWVKIGLLAGIALSLAGFWFQYGDQRERGFITRIELLDERWRIETGDGATHHAMLTSGYAHPGIVILNFRLDNGGRKALTLLPDAADANGLRRLRVWLRTRTEDDEPNPW